MKFISTLYNNNEVNHMELIKKIFIGGILCAIVGCAFIAATNLYMYTSTRNQFDEDLEDADCILVLGAGIRNNKPTPMLRDRLEFAINLYKEKKAPKIIMSGDHGEVDYNEVAVMKKYALDKGIKSSDIFMDHAGFSTYDSIYRARDIFKAKKIIIVTQDYHLYRALYIASSLGLEAVGVPANPQSYAGQPMREVREIVARTKDVLGCIIKPEPKYLGEAIPVSGDGDITNDIPF